MNQPTFSEQIEEARKRLGLPDSATAWQVMCENAAAESANEQFAIDLAAAFGINLQRTRSSPDY